MFCFEKCSNVILYIFGICTHTHAHIHIRMHALTHACMNTHVCMHTHTHAHTHTTTHTHTHTHSLSTLQFYAKSITPTIPKCTMMFIQCVLYTIPKCIMVFIQCVLCTVPKCIMMFIQCVLFVHSFSTVLMLVKMVVEYCQCVTDIPTAAPDLLTRLVDLLKVGCAGCAQRRTLAASSTCCGPYTSG